MRSAGRHHPRPAEDITKLACTKRRVDVGTGPELHQLLDQLRKGDVVVVWKLDRLSRSLRDVLTIMDRLGEVKAGFRSLTEAIDTTIPARADDDANGGRVRRV